MDAKSLSHIVVEGVALGSEAIDEGICDPPFGEELDDHFCRLVDFRETILGLI